ncbi:hypothetical protein [Terricaulis sp.]|uniref:hypothetical protein n=1 Tax=Terricaulis sp. TaxID=2768686 RepID=UPI0037841B7B
MVRPLEARAPAGLGKVIACVESVDNYSRLRMADDFAHQLGVSKVECEEAVSFIDAALKDEKTSNADIKGLLNRVCGDWSYSSPFGADAKAARNHLAAARDAIAAWDGWIS